jgi:hypothetical protein
MMPEKSGRTSLRVHRSRSRCRLLGHQLQRRNLDRLCRRLPAVVGGKSKTRSSAPFTPMLRIRRQARVSGQLASWGD